MPVTLIRQFRQNQSGGVVLIFALMVPVLMGLSAAAMEYAGLVKRRAELQRAADAASIAGVNQFKLANTDDASVIRFAIATANLRPRNGTQVNAAASDCGGHWQARWRPRLDHRGHAPELCQAPANAQRDDHDELDGQAHRHDPALPACP